MGGMRLGMGIFIGFADLAHSDVTLSRLGWFLGLKRLRKGVFLGSADLAHSGVVSRSAAKAMTK